MLDGTLSKYEKAADNIKRSLKHDRPVFIFYIYQQPEVAWKFTRAREKIDGRNIPKPAFIKQFLEAKKTVKLISDEFGDDVSIFLVKKDFEKNTVESLAKISNNMSIDDYFEKNYTENDLEKCL